MVIEKQPFRKYNLEDNKQDIVNVWLNAQDRQNLQMAKAILRQSKDSTAIKTLMEIGLTKLVDDKALRLILDRFEAFQRRNARTGIVIDEAIFNIPNRKESNNLTETEAGACPNENERPKD